MRATGAVRVQASRNREVAGGLGALAEQLAAVAAAGAQAAGEARERVATVVRAGGDVAGEAGQLAELTAALRGASARLDDAIARFREEAPAPADTPAPVDRRFALAPPQPRIVAQIAR